MPLQREDRENLAQMNISDGTKALSKILKHSDWRTSLSSGNNIPQPWAIVTYSLLGLYAWVQGRRATSKVTATSGGRLTKRYAWVPGRPIRRAWLGVNLPLRVPPCKLYPEEVTELKMAALILLHYRRRRLLRRNRIFRDRTNPLDKLNDLELF